MGEEEDTTLCKQAGEVNPQSLLIEIPCVEMGGGG